MCLHVKYAPKTLSFNVASAAIPSTAAETINSKIGSEVIRVPAKGRKVHRLKKPRKRY